MILLLFMTKILVLLQVHAFLLTCITSGRFTGKKKICLRPKINN